MSFGGKYDKRKSKRGKFKKGRKRKDAIKRVK
jgi:hypothetical protein